MDEKHPNNTDSRPKRRKDKDNPYEIFTVGIETDHPQYYICFKDGLSTEHFLEIGKELFDQFDRFELDDLSYLNEVDNHYEHSELTEASLNARAFNTQENVETIIIRQLQNEILHKAILQLPETQRRRLVLHYFWDYTYQQIAEMEGCKHPAIIKSIRAAIANLKKNL